MNVSARKITVRHNILGPEHDPYDETTIEVKLANKTAVFTRDGLGTTCLKLLMGNTVVEAKVWLDTSNAERDKAAIDSFRRQFEWHVGIRPEQALEQWERDYVPDPIHWGGP